MFEVINGVVSGASLQLSPNCNQRPPASTISLLVIHNISLPAGCFKGSCVQDLFLNQLNISAHPSFSSLKDIQVSAHLFIRRGGEILQFVNLNERAWHAGESVFEGQVNCNDFSIGIELEGCDHIAYTAAQYTSLSAVTREIMTAYPSINIDNIVGHNSIAPQRKTDPGAAFDWQQYRQQLLENSGVE